MPSVQTNVWGPPQWLLYHLLPFSYPPHPTQEDRNLYAQKILTDFQTLLCTVCRDNVPANVAKLGVGTSTQLPSVSDFAQSPYFDSPDTLAYFFFALHNEVNRMLGKPVIPPSHFRQTIAQYQFGRAKQSACTNSMGEQGCMTPQDGYHPCMTRIAVVTRPVPGTTELGPAFYFEESLKNAT